MSDNGTNGTNGRNGRLSTSKRPSGHHQVVVVGSGYGGAVVAARLSGRGVGVCLLERGEEIRPGGYPETVAELWSQLRFTVPFGKRVHPSGMFDLHHSPDVNVLSASGLGGTSLINAGVALRVDGDLAAPWPTALRTNPLSAYYERAEKTIGIHTFPHVADPAKFEVLKACAPFLGAQAQKAPVAVTFTDAPDGRLACNFCGNCVSGCNRGSKNTLIENYLPLAAGHGAQIFTNVEVRAVQRSPSGHWVVGWRPTSRGGGAEEYLTADVVVLAAGTLGSTEILLRSRERGLKVSSQVGRHFTGNGDALDVVYDSEHLANGVGASRPNITGGSFAGPCITGFVQVPPKDGSPGYLVQDGVIPGGLAQLLPVAMAAAAARAQDDATARSVKVGRLAHWAANAAKGRRAEAIRNSFLLLVMADDDDRGTISLRGDEARVDWPSGADRPVGEPRREVWNAAMRMGGTFLRDPISAGRTHAPITVHPLGGCVMADTSHEGVVDHQGRVFTGTGCDDVYPGLFVSDGSVIPAPLGVNPLLTIAALAERAAEMMTGPGGILAGPTPSGSNGHGGQQ